MLSHVVLSLPPSLPSLSLSLPLSPSPQSVTQVYRAFDETHARISGEIVLSRDMRSRHDSSDDA